MTHTGPCLHDIPTELADPEARVRARHVTLLADPTLAKNLRQRATIIREIRSFLDGRGFTEVQVRSVLNRSLYT